MEYDPMRSPDPEEWNALDESERIEMAEEWHRRNRIKLPSVRAHAIIHAVVENQIAMGDGHEAKATLERLMREGLDRHEAVHAIGSVVSNQIFRALKYQEHPSDATEELRALSAESWRKMPRE